MEKMSFEEALKKLEIITKELEMGEIDLDTSMKKYEEANKLMEFCSKKLKEANEVVAKIVNSEGKEEEFKEE